MTLPVLLEARDNCFAATLAGAREVRVAAATRAEAIAARKAEVAQRLGHGELVCLEVESSGIRNP